MRDFGAHIGTLCWIIIFYILGLGSYYCIQEDAKRTATSIENIKTTIENFENPGKIVEIYAYRTGTKAANYRYPIGCIIEDKKGTRLILRSINQPGVEGDYWNICFRNDKISLCELVKKSSK